MSTALASPSPNTPLVFERDGRVFARSRAVAAHFGKRHDAVLRDIRRLHCSSEFRAHNFVERSDTDAGRPQPVVDMTKDGFTFLVFGWTGKQPATFKEAYITRFNAMEAELLRRGPATPIPQTFAEALRLAADLASEVDQQRATLAIAGPKAAALDLLEAVEGSLCLQDAAKALGLPPKKFTDYLHAQDWIFRRQGSGQWAGHATHTRSGLLDHRPYIRKDREGNDRNGLQVVVTPKGMVRLARELSATRQGDLLQ